MNQIIRPSYLLIFFLFINCSKQNSDNNLFKNDWKENELRGKVKSFEEASYIAEDSFGIIKKKYKNTSSKIIPKKIIFNQNGQMIEKVYYKKYNDKTGSRYVFKYDDSGNLIEKSSFDSKGILYAKRIYTYNKYGNKISEIKYNDKNDIESKEVIEYDGRNKISKTEYGSNGKIKNKMLYEYDKDGNRIKYSRYNSNGELVYKSLSKFDKNGNKIEYLNYGSDGKLKNKNSLIYDRKDSLIEKIYFNYESKETQKNKYDKDGNLVESKTIFSDGSVFKETLEYDEFGREIKAILKTTDKSSMHETGYDKFGNEIFYRYTTENSIWFKETKYKFDKKNNWIKKTIYKQSVVEYFIERNIEYFD
mgnify:CR=1 FL=1